MPEKNSMKVKSIVNISLTFIIVLFQFTGCLRPMEPIENENLIYSGKIAFFSDRNKVQPYGVYNELFIMDADGKNQDRLIQGSSDYASFSPDGSEIVFSMSEYDGDLFKLSLKDMSIIRLTFDQFGQYPVYSPDGSRIAFFHQHSLFVMDSDGANIHAITGLLHPSQTYFDFSPDGSKIVVDSNGEIFMVDLYGDTLINMTNHPSQDKMPVFSPDGSEIAFISDREETDQIFIMNSDGSYQHPITRTDYKIFGILRFSPNGDKLLYSISREGFTTEISTINSDGSDQKIVGEGFNPRYSPDGKKIVFEAYSPPDEGWLEIFIMNADGSNRLNLTNNPAEDTHPIIQ